MSLNYAQLIDGISLSVDPAAPANSVNLDSSGKLLVGTSTARNNIDALNTLISPIIQLEGTTANTAFALIRNGNSATTVPRFFLAKTRGSSVGSVTIVQSGDSLGEFLFNGADGTDLIEAASISAEVDGTPGANDMPGRLIFSTTADGSANPTERMRISNAGNVGIGTTSPLSTLHVSGLLRANITTATTTSTTGIIAATQATTNTGNVSMESVAASTATRHHISFVNPNGVVGSISTNGTATAYNTSSDYRLKENVVPLSGAIDRLQQIPVHRFNFIADPETTVDGFIAHEAQAIVPECVTGTKDETQLVSAVIAEDGSLLAQGVTESEWESGKVEDDEGNSRFPADSQWVDEYEVPVYQGIDQSKLVPLLTAALQEAIAEIASLRDRVAALEAA
jgi:hypothetical protein